jgi:hypothetical protein
MAKRARVASVKGWQGGKGSQRKTRRWRRMASNRREKERQGRMKGSCGGRTLPRTFA